MEYANKDEWCYALQAELTRTKRALEIARLLADETIDHLYTKQDIRRTRDLAIELRKELGE